MWRSMASRSSFITNLGRKLVSTQNPSPFQVLHKTLISSSNTSQFIQQPKIVSHQNCRFLSHSSISEFETEVHDPSSSSEEVELENSRVSDDTHVGGLSQEVGLTPDSDGISGNNDAQIDRISKIDQELGVSNEGLSVEIDVEKLENVLSLLQSTVDDSLESTLDGMNLDLSEEFMVRVLETPLVPGEHLIRFFKWASTKDESIVSTSVLSVLASVICCEPQRKEVYGLWDMIKDDSDKKGALNVEILNQLISAMSKLGKAKAAFEIFGKFEELGCVPNEDTYYFTIEALSQRPFYDWVLSVCQKMLDTGMLPDSEKVGKIISRFCEDRREKEAHIIYLVAKEKGKVLPQKAVNFLISRLSKEDETVHLAQEMLADISGEARKHAINPFSWVIRGLCRMKDTEGAKKLLFEMIEQGPPPGNAVFNSVINGLSKAGDMEDAKVILKLMESRGLKPDVYSYSVIMSGYAKGGAMEEACKVLSEAKKRHRKLCPVTFHTLIRGYCKLGEFDNALKLLGEMKDYGVEANVDEYNKLIQSLCLKALDWETAEKLLEEMKQKGLHLPGITRGLIKAVKELEQEAATSNEDPVKT